MAKPYYKWKLPYGWHAVDYDCFDRDLLVRYRYADLNWGIKACICDGVKTNRKTLRSVVDLFIFSAWSVTIHGDIYLTLGDEREFILQLPDDPKITFPPYSSSEREELYLGVLKEMGATVCAECGHLKPNNLVFTDVMSMLQLFEIFFRKLLRLPPPLTVQIAELKSALAAVAEAAGMAHLPNF